jgi:RNA polymerase sigma-70 factor, ECF subfamily
MASVIEVAQLDPLLTARRNAPQETCDAAMNELLMFLRPRVFKIAVLLARHTFWADSSPHDTADDLTNEALMRFCASIDKITHAETVEAWFRTVLRNLITDRLRKIKIRPAERPWDELPDGWEPTDTAYVPHDTCGVVQAALRELPQAHQDVLRLMYWREMTVEEAAKQLGVPPGTVKSRTYYALRNLKTRLREQHSRHNLRGLVAT